MLIKAEGLSAIWMSLPKPLKETEFDIETDPYYFVIALAESFETSPIKHCEQAFWNTGEESKIGMRLD